MGINVIKNNWISTIDIATYSTGSEHSYDVDMYVCTYVLKQFKNASNFFLKNVFIYRCFFNIRPVYTFMVIYLIVGGTGGVEQKTKRNLKYITFR